MTGADRAGVLTFVCGYVRHLARLGGAEALAEALPAHRDQMIDAGCQTWEVGEEPWLLMQDGDAVVLRWQDGAATRIELPPLPADGGAHNRAVNRSMHLARYDGSA